MTQLLDRAIAAARRLPPEAQDDIARSVLFLAGEKAEPVVLAAEEEGSLAESLAQAERGEFASDEEVAAVWTKHGS
jgi:predicted transcriptional regulator